MTQTKYFPSNNWEKMIKPKPHTNEHWFCLLSTEEKAKALETIIRNVLVQRPPMCHDICNREFWGTWLKEKHREEQP